MTTYLQLHLLVSYPPSNLNRDDIGRPKTAIFGGSERLRISSQALKRAWRTSHFFDELNEQGHVGQRTRRVGPELYEEMVEAGIKEENALAWSKTLAGVLAKTRQNNKEKPTQQTETEQLVHISGPERAALSQIVQQLAAGEELPKTKELTDKILTSDHKACDVAMFGRMLADNPSYNTEAAVQVAHAISTHRVIVEGDYFSAVDDLNQGGDTGAGHIGETGFGSGIFYLYLNINQDLLLSNLSGDADLARETLAALVKSCAQIGPSGKAASFGSRCYAHYICAERGVQAPRQLSLAFLDGKTVDEGDAPLETATRKLEAMRQNMDRAYGPWADEGNHYTLDVVGETGSMQELVEFVRGGIDA